MRGMDPSSARTEPRRLTLSCAVDNYRAGWSVVAFLAHRFPYHTEASWTERVRDGRVRVNGRRVSPEHVVRRDDRVDYTIEHAEPPVDWRYDVLHDDGDMLVVSKSGNIPVHACGVYITHTLIARLKRDFGEPLNLCHRLDRETSGVVVLARSRELNRAMATAFAEGRVAKRYLAVVTGYVERDAFTVDAPIGRVDVRSAYPEAYRRGKARDLATYLPKRVVDPAGKPARTRFEVIRRGADDTVVRAIPEQGRTNQIRVHLWHVGHPIVGDKIYMLRGDEREALLREGLTPEVRRALRAPRQMLHCARLEFEHPLTGRACAFEAPLPDDMRAFVGA